MAKISTPARVLVADVSTQFRLRAGDAGSVAYQRATRTLAGWAKTDEANKNLVHALIHLGWCSTQGARKTVSASSSAAWSSKGVDHAAAVLEVGEDAAEAVTRILTALAEAGAPAEVLEVVWATFTA